MQGFFLLFCIFFLFFSYIWNRGVSYAEVFIYIHKPTGSSRHRGCDSAWICLPLLLPVVRRICAGRPFLPSQRISLGTFKTFIFPISFPFYMVLLPTSPQWMPFLLLPFLGRHLRSLSYPGPFLYLYGNLGATFSDARSFDFLSERIPVLCRIPLSLPLPCLCSVCQCNLYPVAFCDLMFLSLYLFPSQYSPVLPAGLIFSRLFSLPSKSICTSAPVCSIIFL